MGRHRRKSAIDYFAQLAVLGIFFAYAAVANFWSSLSSELQIAFVVLVGATIIGGMVFVVFLIRRRRQKQRMAWEKAMRSWCNSSQSGKVPQFNTASDLSPAALERFAMQIYREMGYRVTHTGRSGDHGVDVRLVNPLGETELVQCKQWNRAVGEPEVRDLMGAITHEKAAYGYIWAPGGFSVSAIKWAKGKPITLADNEEIGRIVESAYVEI